MRYFGPLSFDEAKSERNRLERGLPFELAAKLDLSAAVVREDRRRDYGEQRFRAVGYIGDRLFVLVFTPRGPRIHVISFRKANAREEKKYAQAKA
jgi:hypothetical protein